MADVVISYSKLDQAVAKALAEDLIAHGLDVWWDFQLFAGDDYHNMIRSEIARAKAVIVIWSDASVASQWVRGEAQEASDQHKLISAHLPSFDPRKAPINFRALHCEPVTNRPRIISAVERKGAKPKLSSEAERSAKSDATTPSDGHRSAIAAAPQVPSPVPANETANHQKALAKIKAIGQGRSGDALWIVVAAGLAVAALPIAYAIGMLFEELSWRFLGRESGTLVGGLLTWVTAGALVFSRWGNLTRIEVAMYWLGATLAATLTMVVVFANMSWSFLGYNLYGASGSLVGAALTLISAIALTHIKLATTRVEVVIYWLGVAITSIFTLAQVYVGSGYGYPQSNEPFLSASLVGVPLALVSAIGLTLIGAGSSIGAEAALYWLGIVITGTLLMNSLAGTQLSASQGVTIPSWHLLSLAAGVLTLVSFIGWAAALRRPDPCQKPEVALYWLGLSMTGTFTLGLVFFGMEWSVLGAGRLGTLESGWIIGASLSLIATIGLALLQGPALGGAATATYWLSVALTGTLALGSFTSATSWSVLGNGQEPQASGYLFGFMFAFVSAIALMLANRSSLNRTEAGIYWLGIVLTGTIWLGGLFQVWDWRILSGASITASGTTYDPLASGNFAGWGCTLLSAIVMAWIYRGEFTRFQTMLLWLGVAVTGTISMALLFVIKGWSFFPLTAETALISGWLAGAVLSTMASVGLRQIVSR